MLSDHLEGFTAHLRILHGLKDKSIRAYCKHVEEFIAWAGDPAPGDVNQAMVEGFLKHLFIGRGNSNQTRRTKLLAVDKFWRFLKYSKVVPENITEEIPRPRVKNKMMQDFSRNEVLYMFKVPDIYSEKGLRDICILICLAFAGCRVSEVVGLRLSDLRDDGQYIDMMLSDDIVKQDRSRIVDLWKAPSIFIRQWLSVRIGHGAGSSSPLFVSYRRGGRMTGNPLTSKDIDRLLKRIAEDAGLRKTSCHAHMFRATHGADLRHIEGMDIAAIAQRLGHKSIATTDKYIPKRGRITKTYRSLRDYWREFETLWG